MDQDQIISGDNFLKHVKVRNMKETRTRKLGKRVSEQLGCSSCRFAYYCSVPRAQNPGDAFPTRARHFYRNLCFLTEKGSRLKNNGHSAKRQKVEHPQVSGSCMHLHLIHFWLCINKKNTKLDDAYRDGTDIWV